MARKPKAKQAPAVKLPAVVRVTKGGDGGAAVPEHQRTGGSYAHHGDNARRVLTGRDIGAGLRKRERREAREAFEAGLVATDDPFDVAHADREPSGRYMPQGRRSGPATRPRDGLLDRPRREYPEALMVGTGAVRVSIDSQWDAAHERERALGLRLGVTSSPSFVASAIVEQMVGRFGARGARNVLQQRTRQDMTPHELELERQASAMLGGA